MLVICHAVALQSLWIMCDSLPSGTSELHKSCNWMPVLHLAIQASLTFKICTHYSGTSTTHKVCHFWDWSAKVHTIRPVSKSDKSAAFLIRTSNTLLTESCTCAIVWLPGVLIALGWRLSQCNGSSYIYFCFSRFDSKVWAQDYSSKGSGRWSNALNCSATTTVAAKCWAA